MKLTAPKYLAAMGTVDKDGRRFARTMNFNPMQACVENAKGLTA
jgi:hypothetical protein